MNNHVVGVMFIEHELVARNHEKAELFLKRIKPLLFTKEYTFAQRDKNIEFDRLYSLTDEQKAEIIKSLTPDDCISVEPNNNPRYPNAEVYAFIKGQQLLSYGEVEYVRLYIKMYLDEKKHNDMVIIISFHPEGMYD